MLLTPPLGFCHPRVRAITTTRKGGVSSEPWDALNLGVNTSDAPANILRNRTLLSKKLHPAPNIQWMTQVHKTHVEVLHAVSAERPEADAAVTQQTQLACAVLTADCMPVVFAARDGSQVGVAHAGWRGLTSNILLATLAHFDPCATQVWIAPCIGAKAFEVGEDVVDACRTMQGVDKHQLATCLSDAPSAGQKYHLDLVKLARYQLCHAGVGDIQVSQLCTYSQPEQFFSYRRDGETGRMATLVWLQPSTR